MSKFIAVAKVADIPPDSRLFKHATEILNAGERAASLVCTGHKRSCRRGPAISVANCILELIGIDLTLA